MKPVIQRLLKVTLSLITASIIVGFSKLYSISKKSYKKEKEFFRNNCFQDGKENFLNLSKLISFAQH